MMRIYEMTIINNNGHLTPSQFHYLFIFIFFPIQMQHVQQPFVLPRLVDWP
jgi:hypothetical protein